MAWIVAIALLSGSCRASEVWVAWGTETYRLEAGESFQFRIRYEQIPVRAWRLVVEADQVLCDLHVLRMKDESLLYFKPHESRHRVDIPWGKGEEILAYLTAVRGGGVYTVKFLGPPPDEAPASYSYDVNRALEAYAAGKRLQAESLCNDALKEDPGDGVARVMLAGFLRDRRFYERAAGMIDEALQSNLPAEMRVMAEQLQQELTKLRAPLPEAIRRGLIKAENHLADENAGAALSLCDDMLAKQDDLSPEALSQILRCRGEALCQLERNFEAIDAFTQALAYSRSREIQAGIYYRMGRLFLDMDNPKQAEGALNIARKYGLPAGLDLQAAEMLERIQKEK